MDILASGLEFPEGPAFASDGSLWWVEYDAGSLSRLDNTGVHREQVGGSPNGLAFDDSGYPWICDAERNELRRRTDQGWQTVSKTVEGHHLHSPNDLVIDRSGTVVFTCSGEHGEQNGYVCRWRQTDGTQIVCDSLVFPNGLTFIEGSLVVADTDRGLLLRGDWDPGESELSETVPWVEVGGEVGPDGMAKTDNNELIVALYGSGCLVQVDSNGDVLGTLSVPGSKPTNITIDPAGDDGIIVTEAEMGRLLSFPDFNTI